MAQINFKLQLTEDLNRQFKEFQIRLKRCQEEFEALKKALNDIEFEFEERTENVTPS